MEVSLGGCFSLVCPSYFISILLGVICGLCCVFVDLSARLLSLLYFRNYRVANVDSMVT